jgi:hypothetical protein
MYLYMDALAITSLVISSITAIGSVLAYYKCKSCKWFCFECDCFPTDNNGNVINDGETRHESPTIIIRQESPMIVRQESPMIVRQESPMMQRHESPVIIIHSAVENEITPELAPRGRSPIPYYNA